MASKSSEKRVNGNGSEPGPGPGPAPTPPEQTSYAGINSGGQRPLSKDAQGRLERLAAWFRRMAQDGVSADVTVRLKEGVPIETLCVEKQILRVDQPPR